MIDIQTIIYYWEYFIKKVKCVSRLSRLQGKNPVLQQVKSDRI